MIPDEILEKMDAERFRLAAHHLQMASHALACAMDALRDLPSGREARDVGPEELPRTIDSVQDRVREAVEMAHERAGRAS